MPNLKMSVFVLLSLLVISGCSSTQRVERVIPPPPPAALMQKAPDLQQMLNSIIGVSETGSQPSLVK
ncbi:hypothetical protein B4901_10235 [Yersinia frederiksenii]|nr:hypothetical protein B4901_10235 [Yersinia frederiksenii]